MFSFEQLIQDELKGSGSHSAGRPRTSPSRQSLNTSYNFRAKQGFKYWYQERPKPTSCKFPHVLKLLRLYFVNNILLNQSAADPVFPGGGERQPFIPFIRPNFPENEENWTGAELKELKVCLCRAATTFYGTITYISCNQLVTVLCFFSASVPELIFIHAEYISLNKKEHVMVFPYTECGFCTA